MTTNNFGRYAAILAAGVLLGWSFGQLLADSTGPVNEIASPSTSKPDQTIPLDSAVSTPRKPNATPDAPALEPIDSERTPVESEEEPLISERLLNYAREQIRLGWKKVRPHDSIPSAQAEEAIAKYEKIVLVSPELLGRTLAEDQDELEVAQANGAGFALLELMLKSKAGEQSALVANDPDAMAAFFAPETSGPTLSGFELDESGELADGTTLVYPPGVYSVRFDSYADPFPRDLTIRGAGMDQTLLFVRSINARSVLNNLTIQNCTVYAENGTLIDLRREPCSMLFENARFLGFDTGAGGSDLLDAVSGVFLARNCVFDGRYGNSPGSHTSIFDVRSDGLLARFENSTFHMVNIEATRYRSGARVVFAGCRFLEIPDRLPKVPRTNLSFPGTTFEYYDNSLGSPSSRDLNELFPDWKDRRDK